MSIFPPSKGDGYGPLYLLASVGAGGLTVSFFMWLMFWVPHPGRPVPIFEDISAALTTGGPVLQAAIVGALLGIAAFALLQIRLLIWNIAELRRFRLGDGWTKARASNAESQILALPLALAMMVNVGFILGLVFVPGLWSIVEFLFPAALVAFTLIGLHALYLVGRFLSRVLTEGGFNCSANNSFAQMLMAFALAMVAVGLAAPAAMSGNALTAGISLALSTGFLTAAGLLAAVTLILGLRSMMEHGAAPESAPTLMILVPLMTVVGIAVLRQNHGMHTLFDAHTAPVETLMTLVSFFTVQLLFLGLGLAVLGRQGYASRFIFGQERSAGSYALVCPGVALSVMIHFLVNKGLVGAGLIEKFGLAYLSFTAIALAIQVVTIGLVLILNTRHFGRQAAMPAG